MSHLVDEALKRGAIPYAVCPRDHAVYTKHSEATGRLGHLVDEESFHGWCVSSWKYAVIEGLVWGWEPSEESK